LPRALLDHRGEALDAIALIFFMLDRKTGATLLNGEPDRATQNQLRAELPFESRDAFGDIEG
jgi:hypothetical protein